VSTAETRRVIAGHVAALQRGDAHSRRASFTPKASWTIRGDIPVAGTWTGPGEILDGFLAKMTATLDPQTPVTQDLHRIIADGDWAFAERTNHAPRPQRNTLRQRLCRRLPPHRQTHRRRHRVQRHLLHEARRLRSVTGVLDH
jgi:ketosteroid isomerase-like protein